MGKWFFYIVLGFLFISCTATKLLKTKSRIDAAFEPARDNNHFTGFLLMDPISKDTLYSLNSQKYFTPASTAKIFTLFTALQLLPDRLPALKYTAKNDTLYFEGTGDPTLLHSHFKDSTVIEFLKGYKHLAWNANNYQGELLGPGWAVEDYQYYYQVERGALPLYGNVVTIHQTDSLQVSPAFFKKNIVDLKYRLNREMQSNTFYFSASRKDTVAIPYRTDSTLTKKLLETVLQKKIHRATILPEGTKSVLHSVTSDSVYKIMMQESDNFLADQLLIVSSSMLSDTLDGKKAREYMLANQLSYIKQPPRWVDGSGLSRYNLFTPESMVQVLDKLYAEIPMNRLFNIFPAGGDSGTLQEWYAGETRPYLYAKSGSIGNNYSLSGYILTKSGRVLIFSFMNNHFTKASSEIKTEVQRVLESILDTF